MVKELLSFFMNKTLEDIKKDFGIGRVHWKVRVHKNKSDGKQVRRKTVKKQDRFMLSLGSRVLANSVLCTRKMSSWQCAKLKRVITKLATCFVQDVGE